ncbi:MAG: AgmX/PglI C-terminal domain-containing protein [Labilithrix sp.]|nr:AgmX/PglI C-terminal domain-containing protein [Labilithrix sp.]
MLVALRGPRSLGLALAFAGLLACKGQGARPPRGLEGLKGVDCAAVKAPAEPDLMAWDASSRAQLDKLRRQGVVAVRYEAQGCDVSLELLPQCVGPKNRYVYSPFSATDTKIARDHGELLAQLPLGAENVSGWIAGRRALRTDAKVVGAVGLPTGSTVTEYDLVGPECKRATHVVGVVYVGGFAMAASDARDVAATDLFASPTPVEGMTREGQAQICERAEAEGIELSGCAVPLRVALIPLDGKAPPLTCPAGLTFDGRRCLRPIADACAGEPASGDADAGCASRAAAEPRVFDQAAVERVVRERHGAVRRKCWESASESVRRVNVNVKTTIDPQGHVARADAELVDSDGSADVGMAVARCIAGEIRTWQFPEPERQQVLTLPFHLIRQ